MEYMPWHVWISGECTLGCGRMHFEPLLEICCRARGAECSVNSCAVWSGTY